MKLKLGFKLRILKGISYIHLLYFCIAGGAVNAQLPSHEYPLIGWMTFTGAVSDFYSRFDLITYRYTNIDRLLELKQLNPKIVVVWTIDWNTARGIPDVPNDWILKDSKGNILHSYGNLRMMNLSDKAPPAESGPYNGKTYRKYLAEYFEKTADLEYFDGWGSIGVWGGYGMSYKWSNPDHEFGMDVDIDNNGINDHNEYSKDEWISHWQAGVDEIMINIREKLNAKGPNKLLIINTGAEHHWGFEQSNGVVREKLRGHFDDNFNKDYYGKFAAASAKPMTVVADGFPHTEATNLPSNTKNDYKGMRYGLVTSMFNDHYFSFQSNEADEHYWSYWYDEFDASLGKPTSGPIQIREGLWARFFEKGAALASTDGIPKNATDADLRSLPGYRGPYFRFRGGQDVIFNNGKKFDSVYLFGERYIKGRAIARLGDGILLFKTPTTIVSDIIIDNVDMGTSPNSEAAILTGGFNQHGANSGCKTPGSNYYVLRCDWNPGSFAFATASPGGTQKVVYTPTIGLAGNYEIFEWHVSLDANNAASNVSHEIKYATDSTTIQVNQRINFGKWNSLGVYHFATGPNSYVAIKSAGANGIVIADAIKFVYKSDNQSNDSTPPAPPQNIKIKNN